MICTLLAAAGATWEPTAVGLLAERPDVMLLKRCVDVDDLLASAAAGQAGAAVVALDAPGLDAGAVDLLRRHGVHPVAVAPAGAPPDHVTARAARIGVTSLIDAGDLAPLPELLARGAPAQPSYDEAGATPRPPGRRGSVVVVWGPAGAPGRTTVAAAVAAELADRTPPVTLVDADPWGGGVAAQLGILDQASGLLAASRLVATGGLPEAFESLVREVTPGLRVLTGLPRPDRWTEVRAGTAEQLLDAAAGRGHVVVDTGFSLEDDPAADFGTRPGRNSLTLGALSAADEVVVVGTADPVGLSRLARALVEVREVTAGVPVRVAVNRDRPSLGWSHGDVVGMVEGFARVRGVHFLPEDRAGVDRALVAGRTLRESRPSPLADAVAGLVDGLLPDTAAGPDRRRWLRRRRAGTARRR